MYPGQCPLAVWDSRRRRAARGVGRRIDPLAGCRLCQKRPPPPPTRRWPAGLLTEWQPEDGLLSSGLATWSGDLLR